MKKYVVVSYDIVDDHIRARVARILLYFGRRVQKSVYECILDDRQFMEMRSKVESEVNLEEDSVRYYVLCKKCVSAIEVVGLGTITNDDSEGVFIV